MDKNYKKNLKIRYQQWAAKGGYSGKQAQQKLKNLLPNSPKYNPERNT